MIQLHRAGHYLDYDALAQPFRERAYVGYVAERRNFPTDKLHREIRNYEGRSRLGKFVFRMFSDEDALLRVKAAKQVLKERVK